MKSIDFDEVALGIQEEQLIQSYGVPQHIYQYDDGSIEYEYTQKIRVGKETIEYNRFFFLIKDGEIVEKRYHQDLSPSYSEIYKGEPDKNPY